MTRRQYLDKRKESQVLAIRVARVEAQVSYLAFHDHLNNCERCGEDPFKLCLEGQKTLRAAVGRPAMPLKNDGEGDL